MLKALTAIAIEIKTPKPLPFAALQYIPFKETNGLLDPVTRRSFDPQKSFRVINIQEGPTCKENPALAHATSQMNELSDLGEEESFQINNNGRVSSIQQDKLTDKKKSSAYC